MARRDNISIALYHYHCIKVRSKKTIQTMDQPEDESHLLRLMTGGTTLRLLGCTGGDNQLSIEPLADSYCMIRS